MRRVGEELSTSAPPRPRGRRTSPDPVGDVGDDAEVVGDEDASRCRGWAWRSRIRSRICAWMVTSSAVVGSSAMRSSGSQASAMAIMIRWRMPPENWCGYASKRAVGLGDADEREELERAARGLGGATFAWRQDDLGDLAADHGDRVERASSGPGRSSRWRRRGWRRSGLALASSEVVPAEGIAPPVDLAGRAGARPMMARAVTLLPLPTLADDGEGAPGPTSKPTPSTAPVQPALGAEEGLEVAHLEDRRRLRCRSRCASTLDDLADGPGIRPPARSSGHRKV